MDWVHCNNCFFLPGTGKRFFLTSCGHLFCGDCIKECTKEHCKLCGTSCTSIPLSSQMKPDVEMYFTDPLELLKKHLKQIQQVAEFQNSHRTRLLTYHRVQVSKLQNLKEDFKKAVLKVQELESERSKLRKQSEYLKQMLSANQSGDSRVSEPSEFQNFRFTPQHSLSGNLNDHSCEDTSILSRSQGSSYSVRSSSSINNISPFPAMPARVTVRTPPIKGKIGIIPGTPQSSELTQQFLKFSGQARDPDTPKVINGVIVSPMNISPCSSANGNSSRGLHPTSRNYSSLSCPGMYTSPSDRNRNSGHQTPYSQQIKLPYMMQNSNFTKKIAVQPYIPDNRSHAKR